ncbi:acyl-CoA N-acyltransferase [Aspergillus avenaceus]|uniref:Glucosamine 6-phosphate N-acetyltransferase n=1 Tax=Aspergillus avenaceus TaxID=36643 RepID=A0A5N6U051_ASPAV|nr:acyl-CoA N-acyltransferase [Aspergillus avenaceus]
MSPNPPTLVPPPHTPITRTSPKHADLAAALQVRFKVFVEEQHCSADGEIDPDDPRSWHWVLYHGDSTTTTPTTQGPEEDPREKEKTPIATVRLVPPPHAPHETLTHAGLPAYDVLHEPYVKITRVAVLPEYRGLGLGKYLMGVVLRWVGDRGNWGAIRGEWERVVSDGFRGFRGLVLVHAQMSVVGLYEGLGFEVDEGMGRWHEEGIEHVGMWKRV